ncbi:hypothetical protein ACWEKR_32610 [Nocardia sp. NPDC004573]
MLDQFDLIRGDPSLIPEAVAEIRRYTTVVNYFIRTAVADTVLGDVPPVTAGASGLILQRMRQCLFAALLW